MDFGQIWAILRKSGLIEMDDPPLFPPQIQAPQAKILGFLSMFLSAAGEHFAPPRARASRTKAVIHDPSALLTNQECGFLHD